MGYLALSNHNPFPSPSIDSLNRSWADVNQIVTAQVNQLVLMEDGLSGREPEPQVELCYMPSAGYAEDSRNAASSTLTSLASSGQTDTGTLDILAWRKATECGQALELNLSLLAVVAAHSIKRQGMTVPQKLLNLFQNILHDFPIGTSPIEFGTATEVVKNSLFHSE